MKECYLFFQHPSVYTGHWQDVANVQVHLTTTTTIRPRNLLLMPGWCLFFQYKCTETELICICTL